MRLGYDRDVGDGEARLVRRRPLRPESRDWYGPSDVVPYPMPRRTRIEEVQRPNGRTPRGYAKSSRSLDAYQPAMPPPTHLTRASTDAYKRRPGFSVYEADDDEEDSDERWPPPKPRGRFAERARPRRPLRKPREPTPESTPPTESDEESDEDDDEDSNQIEVVVEEVDDDEPRRHHRRHHRHPSHDDYISSSDDKRPRRRHRMPSPSTSDDIEISYRQASSERGSPDRRPPLRRQVSDTPRYVEPPQRFTSVIGSTRPPVTSRRATKVYESREVIREGRPRRSATIQTIRQSRSSSRRPPSLAGSMYGGSSRNTSPDRPSRLRDCRGCLDEVPVSRCPKLECGHRMCHNCLKRRFKLSMTDPQQMPPTCCSSDHIALDHVDKLFDSTFKKLWNKKFVDYSLRSRLYCPSRRCGEWIRPTSVYRDRDTGRGAARCDRCNTKVCVACNGRWHFSSRCPRDEETARFLEYARHEGRRRCCRCGASAELREGDNHAACRCGANFCIVCGQKPKRCECPWFGPDNPDSDQREQQMNIKVPVNRGDIQVFREPEPPAPKERRAARRARGPTRQRSQIYDEEALMRQQQEREEELARRSHHHGKEDDYDVAAGPGENVGAGNAPEPYRRTGRRVVGAPPSPSQPGFERDPPGGEYYAGGDQSRGARGGSMDRRLAGRFAEGRHGPMPGMEPPPGMMGPNLMGPNLMPPPIGMPPPVREGMYHPGGGMAPHDRVIVERDPNNYDDGDSYYSHSSRSRKSGRRSETPKSSELAGLSGRGTGMGRVDVWRKFVEPGDPEGEIAAAAAAAATATATATAVASA